MEKGNEKRCIVIAVLMILAGVLLLFQRDVEVSGAIGVVSVLPDRVGDYTAGDRLYCQDINCGAMFSGSDIGEPRLCKECGGVLDILSIGEKNVFPGDTVVLKKEYTSSAGRKIIVSVVVSGKEQKSIHRPQQCLPAHGHVIEKSKIIKVYLRDGRKLDVMMLESTRSWQSLDGVKGRGFAGYAYWFIGAGKETPYHLQRLLWMSMDRAFKNKSYRWSYISIMAEREEGSAKHEEVIADFIADIYPFIILPGKGE